MYGSTRTSLALQFDYVFCVPLLDFGYCCLMDIFVHVPVVHVLYSYSNFKAITLQTTE